MIRHCNGAISGDMGTANQFYRRENSVAEKRMSMKSKVIKIPAFLYATRSRFIMQFPASYNNNHQRTPSPSTIRKDLACVKSLRDTGESLCRSYSSQEKLILSGNAKNDQKLLWSFQ